MVRPGQRIGGNGDVGLEGANIGAAGSVVHREAARIKEQRPCRRQTGERAGETAAKDVAGVVLEKVCRTIRSSFCVPPRSGNVDRHAGVQFAVGCPISAAGQNDRFEQLNLFSLNSSSTKGPEMNFRSTR